MAEVASLLVRIGADVSGFSDNLDSAANRLNKAGKQMSSIGKTLSTRVTAPIAAVSAGIIKVGMDFEQQMARVQAISGATGSQLQQLEDTARELGATTEFSATQAGEGLEFLARAGFSVDESIGALPGVLNLASTEQMELGRAADIASNIMSGFGIAASESGRVADVLAAASSSANTNVSQLGEGMKFVAPIAQSLGLSMEETTAAVSLMSDAGIQAGQAGRTLRSALTRLVNPSKQAGELMSMIGLEVTDAQGNFLGLSDVLRNFTTATQEMTEAERAQAAAMIFGQQAASGVLALLEQGAGDLDEFTSSLQNSEGAAENMAGTMRDTTAGSLRELRSATEELALAFFDTMQPAISTVVLAVQDIVRWLQNLSPEQRQIIVLVGGLAAAIGPLLVVLGTLASAVSSIISVMSALAPVISVLTGPAGLILLLVGVIGTLIATNKDLRENFLNVLNTIKEFGKTAKNAISDFVKNSINFIKNLYNRIVTFRRDLHDQIMQIPQIFRNAFNNALSALKNFASNLKSQITGRISSAVGSLKSILGISSPDIITRTFLSMGEASRVAARQIERSLESIDMAANPISPNVSPLVQGAGGTNNNNFNLTQNINSTVGAEEIMSITRRGMRRIATQWRVEDGRLL